MRASLQIATLLSALIFVSGCATWDHQKERRELLRGPKQTSLADAHGFTESKRNAQTDYSKKIPVDASSTDILRFIDEGVAANTLNCRDYFNEVTLASRRGSLARGEFNVGASVATALAAMFRASAEFLAVLGIGVTAVNQLGDTYNDVLIEAPETPAIRGRVLELMNGYAARLRADASSGAMSYPQARVQLAAHQDICSPGSVRELVNTSVRNSELVVTPAGALKVTK